MTTGGGFAELSSIKPGNLILDWIALPEQGLVEIRSGKVDIGQGISTVLAQIAADELQVDLSRVRPAPPSTRYSPDEGVTSGSFSVQHSGDAVRRSCATLRELAIGQCAALWGVERESIAIVDGRLSSGGHGATYWDLPLADMLSASIDMGAPTLDHARYRTVGTEAQRIDLPAKIFGEAAFIHDLRLAEMLHGRIVRRPSRFAQLQDIGIPMEALRGRYPDLRLVRDGNFLGVLSAREEHAVGAAERIHHHARWHLPPMLPDEAELETFLQETPAQSHVVEERGEASGDGSATRLTFSRPFIAHASIGPSCALAHWTDDGLQVWSHSQGIFNLKTALQTFLDAVHPDRAGLALEVHHMEGAGCYGHNPADDVAFDAVILAREAEGRPVRVLWSRADELGCGPLGPAHAITIEAALSQDGAVTRWSEQIYANGYTCRPGRHGKDTASFIGATQLAAPLEMPVSIDPPLAVWGGGGDRNSIPQYEVPQLKVEASRLLEMPIRTSAIRALGGHTNIFAIESMMDELAIQAGRDPVEFRLAHLTDERAKAVIERAVEQAIWWGQPKAEGEGHGLAYARYKHSGAWCAVALRIMLAETIAVTDVCAAVDVGMVVNPDGVRNQIEGGILQSCSWTLKEAIRFSTEEILTRSWEDYPILTFTETPRLSVTIIDRPAEKSLGAGEAATGPTAAAIGNAIRDALGVRVTRMPITFERIMEQLV